MQSPRGSYHAKCALHVARECSESSEIVEYMRVLSSLVCAEEGIVLFDCRLLVF